MKIIVVRHGQTNENITRIMQGEMDTVLNDLGIEQAKEAYEKLKNTHIDVVYCSPMKRTIQTAKIVTNNKHELILDPRLKSRNHGEFQGMSRNDMDNLTYWNYNLNIQYEKTENIRDLYNRVGSLIKELKDKYEDKTVLLVTHSGVCRVLHYYFNGIPENGDMHTTYKAINGKIEYYEI